MSPGAEIDKRQAKIEELRKQLDYAHKSGLKRTQECLFHQAWLELFITAAKVAVHAPQADATALITQLERRYTAAKEKA